MGQQAGGFVHALCDMSQVFERGREAKRCQRLPGDAVTALGPIAESKQRLVTSGLGTPGGNGDGLVHGQIRRG